MSTPQPDIERFTLRKIFVDILQILNLEKGMGYTLKRLLVEPGKTIEEYLFLERNRLTRPFSLIVLLVAIATFCTLWVLPDTAQLLEDLQKSTQWQSYPPAIQTTLAWLTVNLKQYFNLFFLMGLPFISLATFVVFRNSKYYFAEHLILNTYISSPQTLFYLLFIPFINVSGFFAFMQAFTVIAYTVFAYRQLFKLSWVKAVWKSLLSFVLYQLLFGIGLGILIIALVLIKSLSL